MKAIWKILLGATAVAAVAPYSVKKDEETGKVVVKSVTWKATYTKDEDGKHVDVKLLPGLQKDEECECCGDDECCCGEAEESDEGGITIDVTVEPAESETPAEPEAAESEAPAETEEPKPEEA